MIFFKIKKIYLFCIRNYFVLFNFIIINRSNSIVFLYEKKNKMKNHHHHYKKYKNYNNLLIFFLNKI